MTTRNDVDKKAIDRMAGSGQKPRKKDEAALRMSEEHFRILFENAPDAIFVHAQGRFTHVNKAAVELFGASSQKQLLGSPVIDRFHPDCREVIGERMDLLSREKSHVPPIEHQCMRLDGGLVDVRTSEVAIHHDGLEGALIFVRNISNEKRTEEALRASEGKYKLLSKQLSAVLEAVPDCVSLLSPDLKMAWANKNAADTTKSKGVYRPGEPCYNLWELRTGAREEGPSADTIKTGESLTEIISAPDGKIWEHRLIPVKDDTGMVINAISLGRDISELLKLEAQLRQARKMEAIGTLARGIAHDLNNVLAAVIGYTEMAMEHLADDEPASSDLRQVLRAGGRAKDLVMQILSLSRSKGQEVHQAIPIHTALREALVLLRATLPGTIEIQQDFEPSHVLVLADPAQIHQVIMTLSANAAHAMRNQIGVLSISTARVAVGANDVVGSTHLPPGMYLRITVADTGCGMSPDALHHVFEPCFTTKGAEQGIGLGLSVVHGIIVRHGGAVRVDSEPGMGTRFQIYLPCIGTQVVDRKTPAQGIPHGTERLLVIDDEETIAILLRKLLVALGYNVLSLTSPADALRAFGEDPDRFDLVITDYAMPGMTGLELAQNMMQLREDIKIILMTGYNDKVTEGDVLYRGFKGIADKPLDRSSLARLVRNVIDGVLP